MAKGRRQGAEEPPSRDKTEVFSARIAPVLHEEIKREAERQGVSASAVAEGLLQIGVEALAESRRTDTMKALLFFAERLGWSRRVGSTWDKNPTEFAKFRAALLRLVDMFKPAGEPEKPPADQLWDLPEMQSWSVEDWVRVGAQMDLESLLRMIDAEQERRPDLKADDLRHRYGFLEAARALGLDKLRGLK